MRTIYKLILAKFFKAAFVPIVVIELSLVLALFLMNDYQSVQNKKRLESLASETFLEIAKHTANQVAQQFSQAKHELMQLQTLASELFTHPEHFSNPDLVLIKDQGFFRDKQNNRLSYIYTTNKKKLYAEDKEVLQRLSLLVPHAKMMVESNKKLIQSAWVNIDKYYALFYPALEVTQELSAHLDVTKQRFYYEADPKHNPEAKIKFLDLYKESWATALGQLGTYIAPIYAKKRFLGVVGVNVTVNKTAEIFKAIELPFNAYAMLVDEHKQLLVSSNEKRSLKELHATSFYDAYVHAKERASKLQMIDAKALNDSSKLTFSYPIAQTKLKVLFCVDTKDIFSPIESLSKQNKKIGIYIILAIALFYLIFFIFMLKSVRKLAQKIAVPLRHIVSFSSHLGERSQKRLPSSDIEELEHLNKNLSHTQERLVALINIDETTGLLNHQRLRKDSQEPNQALIFFRLLNFDHYNNLFGPKVGNATLLKLIEVIRSCDSFDENAMKLYRDSRDTIAILMPKRALEEIRSSLHAMLEIIATHAFNFEGIDIDISVHSGISLGEIDDDLDLIAQAHIALAQAKAHRICSVYEEVHDITKQYQENLLWSKHLKEALNEGRIIGYFQPIYDYKAKRIIKSEALVRMRLGDEIIAPYKFLYAAQQTGKMHDITLIMLDKVFSMAQKYPDMEFSVNTSFEDFEESRLLETVRLKLKEYAINPSHIIFEILETQTFNDQEQVTKMLKELKELGFKIAIDDFGTGHSNFAHLSMLEVDYIKIDAMFIKELDRNPLSQKMVATLVSFAKQIGAKTIAEFVYNEVIFNKVAQMGVDFAQGYYISKPLSETEFEAFITRSE